MLILICGMQVQCRKKPNIKNPTVAKQVLGKCGARMQIKFPASTRLLNFAEDWGMDYGVYLKVEIEAKDLASFVANSLFAGGKLATTRKIQTLGPGKWWDFKSAQNVRSAQVRFDPPNNWESVGILIDLDNPAKAVIYLEYSGTSSDPILSDK